MAPYDYTYYYDMGYATAKEKYNWLLIIEFLVINGLWMYFK